MFSNYRTTPSTNTSNIIDMNQAKPLVEKMLGCDLSYNGFLYRYAASKDGQDFMEQSEAESLVKFLNKNNLKCEIISEKDNISNSYYIKFDGLSNNEKIIHALDKVFSTKSGLKM